MLSVQDTLLSWPVGTISADQLMWLTGAATILEMRVDCLWSGAEIRADLTREALIEIARTTSAG